MAERVVTEEARTRRRNTIARLHNEGLSERQIASRLNTSRSTVWGVLQELKAAVGKRQKGKKS